MKIIALITISLILNSCYTSKELDREVRVSIVNTIPVTINNTANSAFSTTRSIEQIQQEYLERLTSELTNSKVIIVDQNAEFEIVFTSLTIDETSTTETVNDTSSEQHGNSYDLTTLDLDARGSVSKVGGKGMHTWFANKDKDEKLTNSRSAGQVITGGNKDRTVYREKEFDESTVQDLAGDVGRRSGVSIVKEIIRALK